MSKWEKKFGKYAIPNLTVILIACYVIGYLIGLMNANILHYMTLNPYMILCKGQIWRLFTWIIVPPVTSGGNLFLTLIMLMFYFNLGTALERVWGTWRYNVYIFTGIGLTILGSFVCMAIVYVMVEGNTVYLSGLMAYGELAFSTYYINMSIFLAYAITFPNAEVLLMFFIPVKVKWLGIVYGLMLIVEMVQYIAVSDLFRVAAIATSLLNFGIFWLRCQNIMHLSPKQVKRRADFKHDIKKNTKITRHKCAICGQTEETNPGMEFRFCSKCNGNYEYCSEHLFTHEHVK